MPEVRQFLKTTGHADSYDGLTLTWIPGHTPTLFLKNDAGEEIDRIDLSSYTTEQLHDLVKSKGFQVKPQAPVTIETVPANSARDEM